MNVYSKDFADSFEDVYKQMSVIVNHYLRDNFINCISSTSMLDSSLNYYYLWKDVPSLLFSSSFILQEIFLEGWWSLSLKQLFSSPEPKAKGRFFDHNLSVVCRRCCCWCHKLFTFSSSFPDPLGQFQRNLTQSILGEGD